MSDKLLLVVMDGVGERDTVYGNAVKLARTPYLDWLRARAYFTKLHAHGTYVGLPTDSDMGNSEVGHNVLGSGQVVPQGASLVNKAIEEGSIYSEKCWQAMVRYLSNSRGTLHLMGLLSDGNVHSSFPHVTSLITAAKQSGLSRVRVHILLDGRDVPEKTAEKYIGMLEDHIEQTVDAECCIKVASGGGRMKITMDRYNADWSMVELGWRAHVLGQADFYGSSTTEVMASIRAKGFNSDQHLPPFVIVEDGDPVGAIEDGDAVLFWNYRGDRAVEISRAFSEKHFDAFDRVRFPRTFFAGMMQYDGDLRVPEHYLVNPPLITNTLTETLLSRGVKMYACSETQKFGHVTFFWNGNRSGILDQNLEEYVEIPSDESPFFNERPWMKAKEITDATIIRMAENSFQFGRVNYANGDMVGHTGDLEAALTAMSVIDYQIGRLMKACHTYGYQLIVTADHGNCDEMISLSDQNMSDTSGLENCFFREDAMRTAHSLAPVPFYYMGPACVAQAKSSEAVSSSIANVAATVCQLLGVTAPRCYLESIL